MSSDRQNQSNRNNAQQSTGPRTSAGKAKVSNALKHGLTSQKIVLPTEKLADFDSFRRGLLAALAPQGDLESALAEKIEIDMWRVRRVPVLEATLYRRGLQELFVAQREKVYNRFLTTSEELEAKRLEQKKTINLDPEIYNTLMLGLNDARENLNDDQSFDVTRTFERYIRERWRLVEASNCAFSFNNQKFTRITAPPSRLEEVSMSRRLQWWT